AWWRLAGRFVAGLDARLAARFVAGLDAARLVPWLVPRLIARLNLARLVALRLDSARLDSPLLRIAQSSIPPRLIRPWQHHRPIRSTVVVRAITAARIVWVLRMLRELRTIASSCPGIVD